MALLTTPHERALTLLFSELESAVSGPREAFLGTPGSLDERTNENGTQFWVRRYSDAAGRRLETYLGKADEPEALIPKITQETLAEMIGTTRSRVSFFMNRFRKHGFIEYNGRIRVHKSLLNVILHDKLPDENSARPSLLHPKAGGLRSARGSAVAVKKTEKKRA